MKNLQYRGELVRAGQAALLGVMATAAMTVLMVVCIIPGVPLAFRPFPVELVHHAFPHLGLLALTLVTLVAHFGYGAGAGALFSFLARPMSVGRGLAFGLGLWMVMEVSFVPLGYGWLEFGLGHGYPWAALYTLALHALYGGILGWLGAREDVWHHAQFDEADQLRVA
ncbi:MAG TPA: hypothetical protein VHO06_19495 [Polyangia bacterium]|nr:hypothetical protein [Polyangia bacterium]